MLFLTFFKTLEGKVVTVEMKSDLQIRGTLVSVDQYLNLKLDGVSVVDPVKFPQLTSVKNMFVRGGIIRYVHITPADVDTDLLQDAARRDAMDSSAKAAGAAASSSSGGASASASSSSASSAAAASGAR